jgi:hypothetical protein
MSINYKQEKIDFKSLNQQLTPHIHTLLRQLLPDGILENHEYIPLNPTRDDKHRGSFRINTLTGKWADFATNDKGGDIISLWAYIEGISQTDAARLLKTLVGGAYHGKILA